MSVAVKARCEIVSSAPEEVIPGDAAARRLHEKFGGGFAHRVKDARPKLGIAWDLNEVFVALYDEAYLSRLAVD